VAMQLENKSICHHLRLVIVFSNADEVLVRVVSTRSGVYIDSGSLLDFSGPFLGGPCYALQPGMVLIELCFGTHVHGQGSMVCPQPLFCVDCLVPILRDRTLLWLASKPSCDGASSNLGVLANYSFIRL
jgi:hypothetical protein